MYILRKSLLRSLPVKDVPDRLEVLGLAVLVLEVIGVLPSIDAQNGGKLANNWVLVGVGLDRDAAGVVVLHEPCPAAALDAGKGSVEGALELGEGAVGVLDGSLVASISIETRLRSCRGLVEARTIIDGIISKRTFNAPDGSPPPPALFGARFSQNSEWLMWPPP